MTEPFYRSSELSSSDARRLLLVSYHFPPSQAVGGLRWQKFSRHFAENGYALDVLTLPPEAVEDPDTNRLEDLPDGTRLYGVDPVTPWLERLEDSVHSLVDPLLNGRKTAHEEGRTEQGRDGEEGNPDRGHHFRHEVLDKSFTPRDIYRGWRTLVHNSQQVRWAARSSRIGSRLAAENDYLAVVSSSPPSSAHRAATEISARSDLPLILDFRDPWSLDCWVAEEVACRLWYRIAGRAERGCVESADLIVLNTDPHRELMEESYPSRANRMAVVRNGYDAEDAVLASQDGGVAREDRFLVVYAGSIYGKRDPRPFFRAAGRFVDAHSPGTDEFGVEFLGSVKYYHGLATRNLADSAGLGPYFEEVGYRPREEALRRMARASLLLSLPQHHELCIPAKIYEYMMFRSWLLALEERGSATERLLRKTSADVAEPSDEQAIVDILGRRFRQWKAGKRPARIGDDEAYSRSSQAERFIRLIEGVEE